MIELTTTTAQTVAIGQQVVFDKVKLHTGCAECYVDGTNSVKLRGAGGIYIVSFSGNMSGSAADTMVQLSIALGGLALDEGVMRATPGSANAQLNVAKEIAVRNECGDFNRVSVVNSGGAALMLAAGSTLLIRRVS